MTTQVATSDPTPLWRRLLPIAFGVLLIAFVLHRIDFAAFAAAVRRTNYVEFILFALLFNVALLSADVFATVYVYRRTVAPVRYGELLAIRGASYLPSMLNHHVGQAWLTYFLSKAYRTPLKRAAGATLVVYATTFGALFLFLLVGLPLNHGRIPWLMPTVVVVAGAGVGYAVVLLARPKVLATRPIAKPLFEVGLGGHVTAILIRLPHVFIQFLGAWIPFLFFRVDVPFADALALMPVVLFVVTLPISPQGLGTRDALSITLLSSYAAGSAADRASMIAATTLSWLVVICAAQLAVSLFFMKRAHALLDS